MNVTSIHKISLWIYKKILNGIYKSYAHKRDLFISALFILVPKLKTIQMSIMKWIDIIVIYSVKGILLFNKMNQIPDTRQQYGLKHHPEWWKEYVLCGSTYANY